VSLDVRGKQVIVVGLAASGLAAAKILASEGARVRVTEQRPRREVAEAAEEAEAAGAEVLAGGHAPSHVRDAKLVVASPGVPEHAEVLLWVRRGGIPLWSELELGARLARCPYVAVTGTNGKTTTTEMIAAAMRAGGLDAVACGNVGHPFSLAATEEHQALAVEASSFQLRFHQSFRPKVSVLLNLAPDHLDWHGSFEAYRSAKARVFALQRPGDTHVGNRDDHAAAATSRSAPCDQLWFTLESPEEHEVGFEGDELVARLDGRNTLGTPPFRSASMLADAAAAAAASLAFGVEASAIAEALGSFAPLSHRGEVVATVHGVRYIDDSKATNPHAALATVSGYERVVLVCGGRSKGVDLSPLAAAIPRLAGVVVLGEAASELVTLFDGSVPVRRVGSIEEAVSEAARLAPPDGNVILAPACSSWDMFRDYRERGDRFAVAVKALAEDERIAHA
jgi:UDP-N-acetylmuramoylalanine--D-glutamate ligase